LNNPFIIFNHLVSVTIYLNSAAIMKYTINRN
jgi:hypothetical protein